MDRSRVYIVTERRGPPVVESAAVAKVAKFTVWLVDRPSAFGCLTKISLDHADFTAAAALTRFIAAKQQILIDTERMARQARLAIANANALKDAARQVAAKEVVGGDLDAHPEWKPTTLAVLAITAHCSICGEDRRPCRIITMPGDQDDGVLCHLCDTATNEALILAGARR